MNTRHSALVLLVILVALLSARPARAQNDSQLEAALNEMYTACLFGENNPFSQAVILAQQALAPGISNFVESNLASIPLTPPSLDAQYEGGEIVAVVTGFAPIFAESGSTVGQGKFLVGSNFSYFNLSKIRGEDLSDLTFTFRQDEFQQDEGGDEIAVTMPFNLDAAIFTLYGTYGLTNRLDIGVALPIVRLSIERRATNFTVVGNQTGCRYGAGCIEGNTAGSETVDYFFAGGVGIDVAADGDGIADREDLPAVPESETYLGTLSVRAKYRFPSSMTAGALAALLDVRLPVGRDAGKVLGSGHFGTRLTLIGEYHQLESFRPYVNVGAQFWNGVDSNSLQFAGGFTQLLASKLFFSFDLLGEVDIEDPGFLDPIDDTRPSDAQPEEFALADSAIPSLERDHTLNAGLGLQVAFSPRFHVYGSALFSLLDRGLQSTVAPTAGAALYF